MSFTRSHQNHHHFLLAFFFFTLLVFTAHPVAADSVTDQIPVGMDAFVILAPNIQMAINVPLCTPSMPYDWYNTVETLLKPLGKENPAFADSSRRCEPKPAISGPNSDNVLRRPVGGWKPVVLYCEIDPTMLMSMADGSSGNSGINALANEAKQKGSITLDNKKLEYLGALMGGGGSFSCHAAKPTSIGSVGATTGGVETSLLSENGSVVPRLPPSNGSNLPTDQITRIIDRLEEGKNLEIPGSALDDGFNEAIKNAFVSRVGAYEAQVAIDKETVNTLEGFIEKIKSSCDQFDYSSACYQEQLQAQNKLDSTKNFQEDNKSRLNNLLRYKDVFQLASPSDARTSPLWQLGGGMGATSWQTQPYSFLGSLETSPASFPLQTYGKTLPPSFERVSPFGITSDQSFERVDYIDGSTFLYQNKIISSAPRANLPDEPEVFLSGNPIKRGWDRFINFVFNSWGNK